MLTLLTINCGKQSICYFVNIEYVLEIIFI